MESIRSALALAGAILAGWALVRLLRPGTGARRRARTVVGAHVPQPPVAWADRPDPYRARWVRWSRRAQRKPVPLLAPEDDVWPDSTYPGSSTEWRPPRRWERLAAVDGADGLVRPYVAHLASQEPGS